MATNESARSSFDEGIQMEHLDRVLSDFAFSLTEGNIQVITTIPNWRLTVRNKYQIHLSI